MITAARSAADLIAAALGVTETVTVTYADGGRHRLTAQALRRRELDLHLDALAAHPEVAEITRLSQRGGRMRVTIRRALRRR